MKKISITKLESARMDPRGFATILKAGTSSQGYGGRAKFIRWQDSVNYFHKTSNYEKTLVYFHKSFSSYVDSVKNRKELEYYFSCLNDYFSACKKRKLKFHTRNNLRIQLNPKLTITGQIPLIFKGKKSCYSIYFFSKSKKDWEQELRFPLVQNYFSRLFETKIENIEVGIFSISECQFFQKVYSLKEIEKAETELQAIGKTISELL